METTTKWRSRSLSELPGHLKVPVLRRKDSGRTQARLDAGVAGLAELHQLREQQTALVEQTMTSSLRLRQTPPRLTPSRKNERQVPLDQMDKTNGQFVLQNMEIQNTNRKAWQASALSSSLCSISEEKKDVDNTKKTHIRADFNTNRVLHHSTANNRRNSYSRTSTFDRDIGGTFTPSARPIHTRAASVDSPTSSRLENSQNYMSWDNLLALVGLQNNSAAESNIQADDGVDDVFPHDSDNGDDSDIQEATNESLREDHHLTFDPPVKPTHPNKTGRSQSFCCGQSSIIIQNKSLAFNQRNMSCTNSEHDNTNSNDQRSQNDQMHRHKQIIINKTNSLIRRSSIQCESVITGGGPLKRKIFNPLHEIDMQAMKSPGPLHAVTLQYSAMPLNSFSQGKEQTHSDGKPEHRRSTSLTHRDIIPSTSQDSKRDCLPDAINDFSAHGHFCSTPNSTKSIRQLSIDNLEPISEANFNNTDRMDSRNQRSNSDVINKSSKTNCDENKSYNNTKRCLLQTIEIENHKEILRNTNVFQHSSESNSIGSTQSLCDISYPTPIPKTVTGSQTVISNCISSGGTSVCSPLQTVEKSSNKCDSVLFKTDLQSHSSNGTIKPDISLTSHSQPNTTQTKQPISNNPVTHNPPVVSIPPSCKSQTHTKDNKQILAPQSQSQTTESGLRDSSSSKDTTQIRQNLSTINNVHSESNDVYNGPYKLPIRGVHDQISSGTNNSLGPSLPHDAESSLADDSAIISDDGYSTCDTFSAKSRLSFGPASSRSSSSGSDWSSLSSGSISNVSVASSVFCGSVSHKRYIHETSRFSHPPSCKVPLDLKYKSLGFDTLASRPSLPLVPEMSNASSVSSSDSDLQRLSCQSKADESNSPRDKDVSQHPETSHSFINDDSVETRTLKSKLTSANTTQQQHTSDTTQQQHTSLQIQNEQLVQTNSSGSRDSFQEKINKTNDTLPKPGEKVAILEEGATIYLQNPSDNELISVLHPSNRKVDHKQSSSVLCRPGVTPYANRAPNRGTKQTLV